MARVTRGLKLPLYINMGRCSAQASGCALATALSLLVVTGCRGNEAGRRTLEFSGPTMGTTWSVKVVTGPDGLGRAERSEIDVAIRDLLVRINALMSTWDPESELSRFNRSDSLDPFPVAPETFEAFQWAVQLEKETDGALDITVAPLVDAWGFGAAGSASTPPDEETLARLRDATGVRHLELDPAGEWVRKRRADVRCDFSALVPGYAADRIAALLAQRGFTEFLVDVGGELVARGRNDAGAPWQVAIEQPQAEGRAIARLVPLTDAAIATSGDYRNYRDVNGERLTHILDPATGRPIRHRLASVTVIDELAVRADGLATALLVLGPDRGMALAEQLDLPAVFMIRMRDGGFEQRVSPRFEALMSD